VQIDKEEHKLVARIKRIRRQVDAIECSLTTEDDCADVLMLLANVRGGLTASWQRFSKITSAYT
jgi:DNA-binding FrmR family transcriptional regulator